MATWPTDLPNPLLDGYAGEAGANVQRTEFDAGPARQRLRYGDAPDALNTSWFFNRLTMPIFKTFWLTDINKGTDWFLMDLDLGDGILTYEVRFVGGTYKYQRLAGANWHVNAQLEVRTV